MAAPDWLKPDQVMFWNEIAPLLIKARVLTEADYPALAALCVALGELKYANAQLEKGRLVKTPSGYMQQSPFVGMVNSAIKQIRSLCAEFGMTPSARSQIKVLAGMHKEDEFEQFLNRGKKKA